MTTNENIPNEHDEQMCFTNRAASGILESAIDQNENTSEMETDESPMNSGHCGRTVDPEVTVRRRKLVSRLSLRGVSPHEICSIVSDAGIHHEDETPFTIRTIYNDLRFLDEQIYAQPIEEANRHRHRVLAEIGEVKKEAWDDRQLGTVLKAIKQETDLCSLNAEEPQAPVRRQGTSMREIDAVFSERIRAELSREEWQVHIKLMKIKLEVCRELMERNDNANDQST